MTERPEDVTDGPERLLTLADGVFAIAITLLVLGVSVPPNLSTEGFRRALHAVGPELLAYALSFVVIAALWREHRRVFRRVRRVDGPLIRITLLGLGLVALLPFPTALLAEYSGEPQAVAIYSGAVASVALVHLALTLHLWRRSALLSTPLPDGEARLILRDLGVTLLVFLTGVPVALASASAGKWWWLALLPLKLSQRLRGRRPSTEAPAPAPAPDEPTVPAVHPDGRAAT